MSGDAREWEAMRDRGGEDADFWAQNPEDMLEPLPEKRGRGGDEKAVDLGTRYVIAGPGGESARSRKPRRVSDRRRRAGARSRRARAIAMSGVFLFAVTMCGVLLFVLTDRLGYVFDASAGGVHRLSPRSVGVVSGLSGSYELVVVGDFGRSGGDAGDERSRLALRRAVDRTWYVLEAFDRASENLRVTMIDTGGEGAAEELDRVFGRLVERDRAVLERQRGVVEGGIARCEGAVRALGELSGSLSVLASGVDGEWGLAGPVRNAGAVLRVEAERLGGVVDRGEALLGTTIGRTPVPGYEDAGAALLEGVRSVVANLDETVRGLGVLAEADGASGEFRSGVRRVLGGVVSVRDDLSRVGVELEGMDRLGVVVAARVLERNSAALVIGPGGSGPGGVAGGGGAGGGIAAVEIDELFPSGRVTSADDLRVDLRGRTEELLSGALVAASREDSPVVVVVHAQPRFGGDWRELRGLRERLALRGVQMVEWQVEEDVEDPTIGMGVGRPVVYVSIAPTQEVKGGPDRAEALAKVLEGLVLARKPLLHSLSPSILASTGSEDPMVGFLSRRFGMTAESARPLVRERTSPGSRSGRVVQAELVATRGNSGHPVGLAVDGLSTLIPWPIALGHDGSSGTRGTWLMRVVGGESVWGESDWLAYRQVRFADRVHVSDPPTLNEGRDLVGDGWDVAVAYERSVPGVGVEQRCVVVGSQAWLSDGIAQARDPRDPGRVLYPGNQELFESSVFWLARQEERIGKGASSVDVAFIGSMSVGVRNAVGYAVVLGMPVGVLLLGVLWRLVRG